jgi:hypothetical protein
MTPPTAEVARSPLPDDLERYEGRWVAIRNGVVVASAETVEDLLRDNNVRKTDVLYRVPDQHAYFY